MRARTVILGGGVMGVSIAWHLARKRDPHHEPVVLLEKSALAAGESGRSGAIVRQFYSDREVAAMARDSLRVFAGFETRTGRSIGWMESGVLTLGHRAKPGQRELIETNVAMMRSLGIDVELVDARRLRELVPGIAVDDGTLGAWEPHAGGVDPNLTVQAFAALAREHGAVTRIGVRGEELLVRDGRIVGVRTSDGVIDCEQVVVATGPWTKPLLARAGVELPLRVVRPEQHFLALPRASSGAPSAASTRASRAATHESLDEELRARFGLDARVALHAPHPVLLDLALGFYSRCDMLAQRTRVGRMDYHDDFEVLDPDDYEVEVSAPFQHWARTQLAARLPKYAESKDVDSFVALYTLTPDAQAVLGPVEGRDGPIEGLFVASGFSGHGFKLSPSIGEGMAQMLCGEPVSAFDVPFFAPQRLSRTRAARTGAFGL